MTKFEMALSQAKMGTLQTPKVFYGNQEIRYFGYQLAVHKFNLSLMAKGLKVKGVKLSDIKSYYGLKGRTASDCLPQFEQIYENYKAGNL